MKILVYADPHYCESSSIIRLSGNKYSKRIENVIQSINFVNELAVKENCQLICCLGDFFDSSVLNAHEISGLQDINWKGDHIFITGNHELGIIHSKYSTSDIFSMIPHAEVIRKPAAYEYNNFNLILLPYMFNTTGQSLSKYILNNGKKNIVLGHCDIKGIQLGAYKTTGGFDLEDIEKYTDLFINGHLHNSSYLNKNKTIINLGNLTGLNFSEDAFKYKHYVGIIDTNTCSLQLVENPHAFKFYKIDATNMSTECAIRRISSLPKNSVITVKTTSTELRDKIDKLDNILTYRLVIQANNTLTENKATVNNKISVDYLADFKKSVIDRLGNTKLVLSELQEVFS